MMVMCGKVKISSDGDKKQKEKELLGYRNLLG